jgi:hypothetical protein
VNSICGLDAREKDCFPSTEIEPNFLFKNTKIEESINFRG